MAARTSGCRRFKACASVACSKATHFTDFDRQRGVARNLEEHAPASSRARVMDVARAQVAINKVGNLAVQLKKSFGDFLAQSSEDPAYLLIEARLDDL